MKASVKMPRFLVDKAAEIPDLCVGTVSEN